MAKRNLEKISSGKVRVANPTPTPNEYNNGIRILKICQKEAEQPEDILDKKCVRYNQPPKECTGFIYNYRQSR